MVYTRGMPLNETQLRVLQALDWLFDQDIHRAEGRTLTLAVALIRQALRYPGRNVLYVDHHLGGAYSDFGRLVGSQVRSLIEEDPQLSRYEWACQRDRFRVIAPDITDALPLNWVPHRHMTPEEAQTHLEGFERSTRRRQADQARFFGRSSPGEDAVSAVLAAQIAQAENERIFEELVALDVEPRAEEPEPRSAWERLIEDVGVTFSGPELEGGPDSHEDSA